MKTIEKMYTNTLEVKQSKFMAYLVPFSDFKKELYRLKSEHPKARHFVTASRYINEFDQIVESSSDDGEPKGTSGKPTLAVMQGNDLINCAIITVRYFGGTKLGTGGLVRAYSDATNDVIDRAEFSEYIKKESYNIEFLYSDMGRIEYELGEIKVVKREFLTETVLFSLECSSKVFEEFILKVERLVKIKS